MTTYSALADVRDFGVTADDASDSRVTAALNQAKKAIDDYCGFSFATPSVDTEIVEDVVKGWVPLPTFSNVTAVTVNNYPANATEYETRQYGLRFIHVENFIYYDIDGFAVYPWGQSYRDPVTVKVTATFGTPVDERVALASTMLAAAFSTITADDMLAPAEVKYTNAGGVNQGQGRAGGTTTGYFEVDRLLDAAMGGAWMVN